MSTILTIYSYHAFKRFLLPAINDADYSILLAESLFHIDQNLNLRMEVVDNKWFLLPSEIYSLQTVQGDMNPVYGYSLDQLCKGGNSTLQLFLNGRHALSILVRITDEFFSPYTHYDLSSVREPLSIGRDPDNMICFDYEDQHYLSGKHARIIKKNGILYFEDLHSANGSFINNKRVIESVPVNYGDCIDIFGLRIVCLGNRIAVNIKESGAKVTDSLHLAQETAETIGKVNHEPLECIHHRAPRHIASLDTESVKIEAPPQEKDVVNEVSFLSAIGPALSMSLPMLLGCAFMIYASRASGMNRGAFMYIGLVTAVTSAVIGVVRSVSNMRKARNEYEKFEHKRNERYGIYLKEKENLIKQKYEKNMAALMERYRSANVCCSFNTTNSELWSKNINQPDFLTQRLGVGEVPFMAPILIPEQKFTLADNNLSEIPSQIQKQYSMLHNAPICVDFLEHHLIGVIGGRHRKGAVSVVQSLVAQIAAYNSYTDVKLVFIYDKKKIGIDESWEFAKWLPHVWNENETFRYVAASKEDAGDVFYELCQKFRERAESKQFSNEKNNIPKPYYVMILVHPELLGNEMISKYVMDTSGSYGLTTLYMVEQYEELPNECEFIIENTAEFSGMYHITDDYEMRTQIAFDQVSVQELETLVSNIANVKVQEVEAGGDIPSSISFFEMLGVKSLQDLNVINRWKKNRTYESMKALVGFRAGGEPCYLDIHEKYHGPHGLVAGTTGSGKSETLQTYILSLALNFSPDDVAFFIIDYKGGGMANLFEELPHMIGQISNLSGNQVNRALVAIQSEKDRREELFKDYGVKDIRDYTKLYKNGETLIPLPHLIIVIDEFAEMKHDEPEFIQEIVSISRVGRSLGIHLIMATQKPAGSVSDDIWSNSRFKLCLRVQSRQDSMDMLRKPDAAFLTQSGRCYLQVGNDELYELFQSGYSGAVYSKEGEDAKTDVAKMLNMNGIPAIEGVHTQILYQKQKKMQWIMQLLQATKEVCGEEISLLAKQSRDEKIQKVIRIFDVLKKGEIIFPDNDFNREGLLTLLDMASEYGYDADAILKAEEQVTNAKIKLPQQPTRTQLEAVVSYLQEIASQNGYNHDFSLFLSLLPTAISLEKFTSYSMPWNEQTAFAAGTSWPDNRGKSIFASMGLFDDPENRRQDTYVIDLLKGGNISIFGSPLSGKSTFLQTFVYNLVNRYAPDEVNIYAVEYSARKFTPFEDMPHVGGIIKDNDDIDKLDKFFVMISRILEIRKKSLGDASYLQYVEKDGLSAMPAIVIVIDNYASLAVRTKDKYQPFLSKLTKEGISNGIFLALSAGGIGGGELPNSLAQNFRTVVCLELNNVYDYTNYLRVSNMRLRPESGVKGRGLAAVNGRILEFQTALSVEASNDMEIGTEIRQLAAKMKQVWKESGKRSAPKIPEIPEKPVWEDFAALDEVADMFASDNLLPVGYDCRLAEPYGINLDSCYPFLITGSKKKGKTNLLKVLMLSMRQKGGEIVIVDYHNQFEQIANAAQAKRIRNEEEWYQFLADFLAEVSKRNQAKFQLTQKGLEESDICREMLQFERVSIFIDNLPDFIERAYHPTVKLPKSYHEILEAILDKGTLHNIFWFATLSKDEIGSVSSRQLYKLFLRDKKGIHLGGAVHGTSIAAFNWDNHDRRTLDTQRAAGRGMLPFDNGSDTTEIVIPMVKAGSLS